MHIVSAFPDMNIEYEYCCRLGTKSWKPVPVIDSAWNGLESNIEWPRIKRNDAPFPLGPSQNCIDHTISIFFSLKNGRAWESEEKRTRLVEHHDSYAGLPGDQQKQTSLVENHAGIVVKSRREHGHEFKNEI